MFTKTQSLGAGKEKRIYADGTYTIVQMPFSIYLGARVLCPDGRVRKTKRIAATADTFFSVPCAVAVKGKTVAGFLTVTTREGLSTATGSDPALVEFHPYKYRKNAAAFGETR